ncbi:hypothetical protein B0H16DRAFT_1715158 [Mycena metata]|uniref:RRM domain-containing protein n=1 Tax=Mycena metata TaxID=1033252 RepID=A0AAD7NPP6_9AGAR|nr:hypothetical protein B0H16DRAFT_1715158 [Mycena metata]
MSKLYVGNLSWGTTDHLLRSTFAEFGQVTDTIVMRDRDTGRARGFGFVTYSSPHEADVAISKMNDQDLDGRRLRVNRASGQGGGGGYSNNNPNYSSSSGASTESTAPAATNGEFPSLVLFLFLSIKLQRLHPVRHGERQRRHRRHHHVLLAPRTPRAQVLALHLSISHFQK